MSILPEEESNFLTFYYLNIKVASKAVRVYFDLNYPPAGLAGDLKNNEANFTGHLTSSQKSILYPGPGNVAKSEHFDTTLMIMLLRNMKPCKVNHTLPVPSWDSLPQQVDTCQRADLARVKWYRNLLSHNVDGKLTKTDFGQYLCDLEGAIGRLGGKSLLQEAQLVKDIVLNRSIIDILNLLRSTEKNVDNLFESLQEHSEKICNIQSNIDDQNFTIKEHENKINQLNVSIQKGEQKAERLTACISSHKGLIIKSQEEIESFKNQLTFHEELVQDLQKQTMAKQNQIDKMILQLNKLEIKSEQQDKRLEDFDERFAKQDEQNKLLKQNVDDMKKKLYESSDESRHMKQKRLEDDTATIIEEDVREGTFVTTLAMTDGLSFLRKNGVLLITGIAGTGKSRICRHIIHEFCNENASYKCIMLHKLEDSENIDSLNDNIVILLDEIFCETYRTFNRGKDIHVLDKLYAYACKGNLKIIMTIRDTVKLQCQGVFDCHNLFQFPIINLNSEMYKLRPIEKRNIIEKLMKKVHQSDFVENKGFVDCDGVTILEANEIWEIINQNPVKAFPLDANMFVRNAKYFKLGSKFFDRPTEAILKEVNDLRCMGNKENNCMIQFAVLVFTALKDNCINLYDSVVVTDVAKIIDEIYGKTIILKQVHIEYAVNELKDGYLVNISRQKQYKILHPTLLDGVILSFAQMDEENMMKIIPILSWTFILKLVKSEAYREQDGEEILRIPKNSSKLFMLLADRLVEIYMNDFSEFVLDQFRFLTTISETEIFKTEYRLLLTCLIKAFEKEDNKDKYLENLTKYSAMDILNIWRVNIKSRDFFLASFLIIIAQTDLKCEIYNFILQNFANILRTGFDWFTIDFLKASLITSLYEICATKNVESVKSTFDIAHERNIPVLLDQGINPVKKKLKQERYYINILMMMNECDDYETDCICLIVCIWNALKTSNVPVLEYLLSKYNETPFDVNSFLKIYFCKDWMGKGLSPLLFCKSIKLLIDRFENQELVDAEVILGTACQYQMFDTVEYLSPRFKTFDAFSLLEIALSVDDLTSCNKNLFIFLFSKINTVVDVTFIVNLVLQKSRVPDYMFDTFLSLCCNNNETLSVACKNAYFYFAKRIMENSQNVNFQLAVISTCSELSESRLNTTFHSFNNKSTCLLDLEGEKLKIINYIHSIVGCENIDWITACQKAYECKQFKIIEWCFNCIDISQLDRNYIMMTALTWRNSEMLETFMNKTIIKNSHKIAVIKSITEHDCTFSSSTNMLKLVGTIWDSTEDKAELKMEELVNIAYQNKCFELLMCIHERCNPDIIIDSRKLLNLACEDGKVDVVRWVLQTSEKTTLDINGGKLFIVACEERNTRVKKGLDMINWILNNFHLEPLDLKSGLSKLLRYDDEEILNLGVSLLKKYINFLSKEDREEIMNQSLEKSTRNYVIVNWLLENNSSCSFDKQRILNFACLDAEIETIGMICKELHSLDMNQALINVCSLGSNRSYVYDEDYDYFEKSNRIDCLNLLWKKTEHCVIDFSKLVREVCTDKYVSNNVITSILLHLPNSYVLINYILIACCQQSRINIVKYIFHIVKDTHQLDINAAFYHACRAWSDHGSIAYKTVNKIALINAKICVDFLFKRLHDKTDSLSLVLKDVWCSDTFNPIHYILEDGYYRNIDMKNLMNNACKHGHVKLVQWILANVEHTVLDIDSAFLAACTVEKHAAYKIQNSQSLTISYFRRDKEEHIQAELLNCHKDAQNQNRVRCLALMWHYIDKIDIFLIDVALKQITEAPQSMSETYYDLKNWLLCTKSINKRRVCRSENAANIS